MDPLELTRDQARRVAVRAQRLARDRPADLHEALGALSLLQVDPVQAVARSADLVLWSRIGSVYDVGDLEDAIAEQSVVELRGTLRPAEDLVLYRADMEAWPGAQAKDYQLNNAAWVRANDACRRDVLDLLRGDGPLRLSELPDTCVVPWRSSGWNNNKNLPMLLDLMVSRGEVAVAGRDGREKLYDLAERVYRDEPHPDVEESRVLRDERRLRALGIARSRGPACPVEPLDVGEAGVLAVVEGVRGTWRVDPSYLEGEFRGRAALLSPFDRMIHDRKRMTELFEFEYALEMYKPAEKRRWGYYALPVLHEDRLVGKLDAKADRSAGELLVHALHEDGRWTRERRDAVLAEVEDLARWLDLELVLP